MRAGNLDRVIRLERATETIDANGAPQTAWDEIRTMRAEVVEADTQEAINAYGASGNVVVVFRVRYFDGLTLADRVIYAGQSYDIKQIKEIGRRRALELRTVMVGS